MTPSSQFGVSVVICCHNSARRLPETLAHLAAQRTAEGLPWEVIVVDNGSTDSTADIARAFWPDSTPAPLRAVYEPQLGLSHARERGFKEARYEIVGFVDDDNHVCPEWVQTAAEVISTHPEVGACGGPIDARCEVSPPEWFSRLKQAVAPDSPRADAGDVTDTVGVLNGTGLIVRRSAWRALKARGFRFLLSDRKGASGSAGGDLELCFALRLAGSKIWYDPRLRVTHFIPQERLEWSRWRREARGAGAAYAALALYAFAIVPGSHSRIAKSWPAQFLAASLHLFRNPGALAKAIVSNGEGDASVLDLEMKLGRLQQLIRMRGKYSAALREIETAPWRKTFSDSSQAPLFCHPEPQARDQREAI